MNSNRLVQNSNFNKRRLCPQVINAPTKITALHNHAAMGDGASQITPQQPATPAPVQQALPALDALRTSLNAPADQALATMEDVSTPMARTPAFVNLGIQEGTVTRSTSLVNLRPVYTEEDARPWIS